MKLVQLVSLVSLALASTLANASTSSERSAHQTVESYKELRKACTVSTGDKRHACFDELAALTKAYKDAKEVLASEEKESKTIISQINTQ